MEADQVQAPVLNSWRLNERHYGALADWDGEDVAVGQHQWYHFRVGAPPILV